MICKPLIIGHRGASAVAPENTLAAFARALRDGADGIELDVRLSRDGIPAVIHDATIRRARLRQRFVSRMTSAKLQEIDVGSWFNRRHRPLARLEYTRQTIPTLDEAFAVVRARENRHSVIYVEIKCGRSRKRNETLARATLDSVRRHQMHDRVVVISFNLRTIAKIRELDPSIRTGALFGSRQKALKSAKQIVAATLASRAEQILLHHRMAEKQIVLAARENHLVPVVWTVDDPKWVARARQLGIHALITNNPAAMASEY